MAYTPHTPADVEAMLAAIGVASVDELFTDIPGDILLKKPLDLPGYTEFELERWFQERAAENRIVPPGRRFLGAGAYAHFIPAAVRHLITRGEFMTCYTPYQAEVSQGTLQAMYEFQSHIVALTGLDVANASMYDGATALAEAITMAARDSNRSVVWLPETLHPAYRAVCDTFLREIDIATRTIPCRSGLTQWDAIPDGESAAVVVQTPNALGAIEDGHAARAAADKQKAWLIAVANPTSLAVLAPPGEYGAEVAVGEAQPLGMPLGFGGPYAGYFATRMAHIRKMPGRLAGITRDAQGREGFVLTLQTREQHIRRARATSNICTNQSLLALMATMYLTFIGREGLVEVAETSMARTRQLVEGLEGATSATRAFDTPFFHEATIRLPIAADEFIAKMRAQAGIIAGWPLHRWYANWPGAQNLLLVNCTELNLAADVEAYVAAAASILGARKTAGAKA
jgi:glycine dehydrogenase subunit 1